MEEERRLEEIRNEIDSARREIAKILYKGDYGNDNWEQDYDTQMQDNPDFRIENEYEHDLRYSLDDFEVDRVQELREQIKQLEVERTQVEKTISERKPEPEPSKGGTDPEPEPKTGEEHEETVEEYRQKMTMESARNIRMDEIRMRMMEIRSIMEDPNSGLSDADRMKLETERYNLQYEFENLAGIKHANPTGPSLSNQPRETSEEQRAANNAKREIKRRISERDKRLNEIRIDMMRIKGELDAKGNTEQTPELTALQEEFERLSKMPIEELGQSEPVKTDPDPTKTGTGKGEGEGKGKEGEGEGREGEGEGEGKKSDATQKAIAGTEQEIAEKQEKLEKLKKEIETASQELDELKKKTDASKEELDKLRAEIEDLTRQRDALKTEIADLERKKAELEGKATPEPTKGGTGKEGEGKEGEGEGTGKGEGEGEGKGKGKDDEGEGKDETGGTKAPVTSDEKGVNVSGFWANAIITIILAIRKLTGKDDFGEKTIQGILTRDAAKKLGPHMKENEERLKRLQREAKAAEKAAAKAEKAEKAEGKGKDGEGEEKGETSGKPKAKKEGFFSRLFRKKDDEEIFVIPRGEVKEDLEEEEENPVAAASETQLKPEEEIELPQAAQDFAWVHLALTNPERDENLTAIGSDALDETKKLSDEEIQEMIDNGELLTYSDSISPRQSLVITKTIEKIHKLAKDFGVELTDGDAPRSIESVFAEVSGRMETQKGVNEAMAEQARQSAEGKGRRGSSDPDKGDR